ncbi:hypothetical protein GCM10010124_30860 [Pilimelia terevasa]|uniref:Transposase n=1 Tax=Pilimelia terevasa TaxID=53372 RepID=A0A8J3BTY6_9ACTN|nr:hypothetical protein GCM10010124_30860 [Pilimelia terevasa]
MAAGENRVQRLCAQQRIWSVFSRRARKSLRRSGPPVQDDLVGREFTATAPDRLWLTDITPLLGTPLPATGWSFASTSWSRARACRGPRIGFRGVESGSPAETTGHRLGRGPAGAGRWP